MKWNTLNLFMIGLVAISILLISQPVMANKKIATWNATETSINSSITKGFVSGGLSIQDVNFDPYGSKLKEGLSVRISKSSLEIDDTSAHRWLTSLNVQLEKSKKDFYLKAHFKVVRCSNVILRYRVIDYALENGFENLGSLDCSKKPYQGKDVQFKSKKFDWDYFKSLDKYSHGSEMKIHIEALRIEEDGLDVDPALLSIYFDRLELWEVTN